MNHPAGHRPAITALTPFITATSLDGARIQAEAELALLTGDNIASTTRRDGLVQLLDELTRHDSPVTAAIATATRLRHVAERLRTDGDRLQNSLTDPAVVSAIATVILDGFATIAEETGYRIGTVPLTDARKGVGTVEYLAELLLAVDADTRMIDVQPQQQ